MTRSKPTDCKHDLEPIYEDDILMGSIYYGRRCIKCGQEFPRPKGPLELGTYR